MQKSIRFVIDDRIQEIDLRKTPGIRPTTTLLHWLRSLHGHKGVKEGCGEGDCGACTVVLAEPSAEGKMVYRAVDSCLIFLPMVHGKQVITIENLAHPDHHDHFDLLHPVQQALVTLNGIQCGYCTPGMVMSLFALYKNHRNPSREVIGDALAGNLCRCTGYQPIIRAAESACAGSGVDRFTGKEAMVAGWIRQILSDTDTLRLTGSRQVYFKPFTLKEALRLRKENPGAILIHGSTDVSLRQTKRNERLPKLIDLSAVGELSFIRREGDHLIIGAGTTLETVKQYSEEHLPVLYRILKLFGSLQIRNLATIGGNLGSASPIGDTIPVLIALGAQLQLSSSHSSRILPLESFITGYHKTQLRKEELITGVRIPLPDPGDRVAAYKVSRRRDMDISTLSAGMRLQLSGRKIADISLLFGGMAATVKRAWVAENFLKGKPWEHETIVEAMKILENEFEPLSDARSGADFRRKAAANLLMRFFLETNAR
jgi:xanthine dehydrogenase small subunit